MDKRRRSKVRWILRIFFIALFALILTACSRANYKVLTPLTPGPIRIEYQGIIYRETRTYDSHPPGQRVFRIGYNEICSTVAYDVYIVDNKMYLYARQPFWADMAARSFILEAEKG